MTKVALVFPGQGSQAVGMARELHESCARARETFAEASEAVSIDLADLCFNGPREKLDQTEFTQPCLLAASVAAYRGLAEEADLDIVCSAGHSLGEYSALAAAGVVGFADAVRAVRARGEYMRDASPPGEGGMAAVLGLEREQVEEVCRAVAAERRVYPANHNAPGQVVISGHADALKTASALLKERGGKVRPLKVSGPFHTPLMESAAARMKEVIEALPARAPSFPVIANLDAAPYPSDNGAALLEKLVGQLTRPVLWKESVEAMARYPLAGGNGGPDNETGPDLFIECGPGTVLAGLIKRILPGKPVLPFSRPEHLEAIGEELGRVR